MLNKLFTIAKNTFTETLRQPVYCVIIAFALFFVFKDWIMFYFSDEAVKLGWSRAVLLRYSVVIAGDYFPLGTGFGSFASFFSGQDYSWVYRHYRIDYAPVSCTWSFSVGSKT